MKRKIGPLVLRETTTMHGQRLVIGEAGLDVHEVRELHAELGRWLEEVSPTGTGWAPTPTPSAS